MHYNHLNLNRKFLTHEITLYKKNGVTRYAYACALAWKVVSLSIYYFKKNLVRYSSNGLHSALKNAMDCIHLSRRKDSHPAR